MQRKKRKAKGGKGQKRAKAEQQIQSVLEESVPPVPRRWFTPEQQELVLALWCARKYGSESVFYHEFLPRDIFILILAKIPEEEDVEKMYEDCFENETREKIGVCKRYIQIKMARMLYPPSGVWQIGRVYSRLGLLYIIYHMPRKAMPFLSNALVHFDKNQNYFLDILECYCWMMDSKVRIRDWEGADEYIKCMQSYAPLPEVCQHNIIFTIHKRLLYEEKYEEAMESINEIIDTLKNRKEGDPSQWVAINFNRVKAACLCHLKDWNGLLAMSKEPFPGEKKEGILHRALYTAVAYCMLGDMDRALSTAGETYNKFRFGNNPEYTKRADNILDQISGIYGGFLDKNKIKWF